MGGRRLEDEKKDKDNKRYEGKSVTVEWTREIT